MSTTATISKLYEDGRQRMIYVYQDGYPSAMLPLLKTYDTEAKIEKLFGDGLDDGLDSPSSERPVTIDPGAGGFNTWAEYRYVHAYGRWYRVL